MLFYELKFVSAYAQIPSSLTDAVCVGPVRPEHVVAGVALLAEVAPEPLGGN